MSAAPSQLRRKAAKPAPPAPPAPPMRPEVADWIDRYCEDEGISRVPWWRRLFR